MQAKVSQRHLSVLYRRLSFHCRWPVMRYKSGNRKGGVQQRPILPSATNAPPGGGGLWRRDEADAYYNNPHVMTTRTAHSIPFMTD